MNEKYEKLESYVKKYIKIENDEVSIDWEGIENTKVDGKFGLYEAIINKLECLGVLSSEKKGNFLVAGNYTGTVFCLDPEKNGFPLYFTEREYAEKFTKTIYGKNPFVVTSIIELNEENAAYRNLR